jgi:hypothetical protein
MRHGAWQTETPTNGGDPWSGLVETPAATSYAQTYKWLVGAVMKGRCYADSVANYSCSLSRHNEYVAKFLWNSITGLRVLYRDLVGDEEAITNASVTVANQQVLIENEQLP